MAFSIQHLILVYLLNKCFSETDKYSMFYIRYIPWFQFRGSLSPNWENLSVSLKINKNS